MSRLLAVMLVALGLALPRPAPAQDTTRDEAARLRQEVEKREKELKEVREQLAAQTRQIAELRRQLVESQLQAETLRDRNQRLIADLEATAKAVQKLRENLGDTPKDPVRNPPPADVTGLVTAVAKDGGYLTLNLGNESGLKVGHTLEIFRLKPDAKYLGTIRVIDVRDKETITKPLGRLNPQAIQVGDRVASRIP